ncbi:hypothetical protein Y032_0034g2873 [Ancylostoma ceylanicum]|nr:hypothetical protein Y032_0034g2873 [Ancylostoma ceylanicum]
MLRCEEYFMSRLKIHPLLKSEDVTALPMTNLIIIGISLAILGVAAGALYIPTFQSCLDAVKEHGYDDSFRTYGCVSGVFQSAFAFGGFMGPTVGGFAVEKIGFAWTTTIIGAIHIMFLFVVFIFYSTCCTRKSAQRST